LLHTGIFGAVKELDPNRQLTDLAKDADLLEQLSAASKDSSKAVKAQKSAAENANAHRILLRTGACV
jgi:hypothetical protein